MTADALNPPAPDVAQEAAKKNYAAFLAAIPVAVHRREEKLAADLRRVNARPMVRLARIRQSVETLFSYAHEFVACKKGCAYCCYQQIQISSLEAEYIREKTGIFPAKLSAAPSRDLQEFSGNTPCPFLKQGACSIYEHRPIICRIHVSLDADNTWCRFENWHVPGASVPKPTFHSIAEAFFELNQKSGSLVADIRDFFPDV